MKRCSSLAVCTLLFAFGCAAEEADANPSATARLAQEEAPEEQQTEGYLVGAVTGKVGAATLSGKVTIERFFDEKNTVFAIGRFSDVTGVADAVSKALTAQTVKLPIWVARAEGDFADGSDPAVCQFLTLVLQPLRIDLSGTTITLDKVDLDISATPAGPVVLGGLLCPQPGLFDRGGRLSDLKFDNSDMNMEGVIITLQGYTGLSGEEPLDVPKLSAEPVTAAKPATTPGSTSSTPTKSPAGTVTKGPTATATRS